MTRSAPIATTTALDGAIAAALRDTCREWPAAVAGTDADDVVARADHHGATCLLFARLGAMTDVPPAMDAALRRQSLRAAMWELAHKRAVSDVLGALTAAGAAPLLLKGTALGYGLYPQAALRLRGDTDVLVAPAARVAAHAALVRLGFVRRTEVSGDYVAYQASYSLPDAGEGRHSIDLHWKISNSELLSRLFSHAELLAEAVALPRLSPDARAVGPAAAMLIACLHRQTHLQVPYYVDGVASFSADRLIWLYDIHLLAQSFDAEAWRRLVALAEAKRLCGVLLDGLESAARHFATLYPAEVRAMLVAAGPNEPPAVYLRSGTVAQHWMNFRALPRPAKAKFLHELVFPPADYMRAKYARAPADRLGWLYARRAFDGIAKRLKRPAASP